MAQRPPHSTGEDTDRKPPDAPPLTSATGSLPPNPDVASSSAPTPPPHPASLMFREKQSRLCARTMHK
jgi:hypothetical protein